MLGMTIRLWKGHDQKMKEKCKRVATNANTPGAACTKHLPPCMLLRVELRIGETSMAQNLNYPGLIYFEGRACFSFGAIVEICPFNVGTHSQTSNQNIKTEISKFNSKSEFGFLVKRSGTNIEGARSINHRQDKYKTQNNLVRA